jgi:hypothetical protein
MHGLRSARGGRPAGDDGGGGCSGSRGRGFREAEPGGRVGAGIFSPLQSPSPARGKQGARAGHMKRGNIKLPFEKLLFSMDATGLRARCQHAWPSEKRQRRNAGRASITSTGSRPSRSPPTACMPHPAGLRRWPPLPPGYHGASSYVRRPPTYQTLANRPSSLVLHARASSQLQCPAAAALFLSARARARVVLVLLAAGAGAAAPSRSPGFRGTRPGGACERACRTSAVGHARAAAAVGGGEAGGGCPGDLRIITHHDGATNERTMPARMIWPAAGRTEIAPPPPPWHGFLPAPARGRGGGGQKGRIRREMTQGTGEEVVKFAIRETWMSE